MSGQGPSPSRAVFTIDTERFLDGTEDGAWHYLKLFRKCGIRATFFVCGDVAVKNPALVEGILEGGHEVASHAWRHPYIDVPLEQREAALTAMSDAEVEDDLCRSLEALRGLGAAPVGFRAPHFGLDSRVLGIVARYFKYDSSLTLRGVEEIGLPEGLVELPLTAIGGTGVRLGSSMLFSPFTAPLAGLLWRIWSGDPMVYVAHSFDFVPIRAKLYNPKFRQFWYLRRCGEGKIRVVRRVIRSMQRSGLAFVTAREALLGPESSQKTA